MHSNEQTIHRFYTAFQQLDYTTMQSCYHNEAVFSDPVFGLLDIHETRAMWEMLCKRAKNFSLTYGNIQLLDDEYTTTDWVATYDFGAAGRRVTNRIKAHMRFQDGLIIEHSDAFSIYEWSKQALGLPGWLLGWSGFMHKRVRLKAKVGLMQFMQS
jgi:ketosteroid isomerase-like protein